MSGVTELGYVGFGVSDLKHWQRYATEIAGAEWVEENGIGYLRLDLWHHRIALHHDGSDDLLYVGWRVSDAQALHEMAVRFDAAKIAFEVASDAETRERRVLGLIKTRSPGGIPTEIFWGPQVDAHRPFHPGRPLFGRFKTGDDLGFGHIALREECSAESFYRLLGLRGTVEYRVPLPNGSEATPVFMHCNERQHSIGFGLGPLPKRCHHLMLEYTEVPDLGIASDVARRKGVAFDMTLGTHANDGALTFYIATPSGWGLELGWDVKARSRHPQYYVADVFGHDSPQGAYGIGADQKNG